MTHPGVLAPDYLLNETAAVLFISLRYHLLHPEYVHQRIRALQNAFRHRFLIAQVDTDDCVRPLEAITKAALRSDMTLLLAWSPEEAARWLETLKVYERKPADAIQERVDSDYGSRLTAALTTLKGVNRTDVATLGHRFGSLASLMRASMEELSACPGVGPTKVARLHDAFHQPFRRSLEQRMRGHERQATPSSAVPPPASDPATL
jgi:DNA excision repair protein ERCC-1